MELNLKREPSVKNRRIFVLSGTSDHCESKILERIAKNKRLIENRYSRVVHPLNRKRILGLFTSEAANLLNCHWGEEIIKLDRNCDSLVTD